MAAIPVEEADEELLRRCGASGAVWVSQGQTRRNVVAVRKRWLRLGDTQGDNRAMNGGEIVRVEAQALFTTLS